MDALSRELQSCLKHELELTEQFIAALVSEEQALATPDYNDTLNASTDEKNRYAEQLSKAAQRRHAVLTKLGYSADKSGLDAAAAAKPELLAACQALYERTRRAQDLNTANGTVITTYLEHNQRAIDTLRHLVGAESLYDASGRTASRPGGSKKTIQAG